MYRTPRVLAPIAACLLAGCGDASLPTGDAEWIWPETAATEAGQPAAYVLLADFELDAAPDEAARLFVTADQEYAVHLNGHQIARGGFRRGDPIDEFQVAHLLRAGPNRLTIEVRTPYGDGGVLAGIELTDGSMPVTTDRTWRFLDTWEPLAVKGAAPVEDGHKAGTVRSWGRPPVGRWGRVVRGELARPEPIWRAVVPRRIVRVSTSPGLEVLPGERSAFRVDFGREVTGVLELEFRPGSAVGAGRLKFCRGGDCEWRPLVLTPGRPAWRDSASRTFDTVEVYGLKELRAVRARS